MRFVNRFIYLGYYLYKLDWKIFFKFLKYTSAKYNKSYLWLLAQVVRSIFKYNISILEFFQFRFIEKSEVEKDKWAGTGFMYESINKLNPRENRNILSDKTKFIRKYHSFLIHKSIALENLTEQEFKSNPLFANGSKLLLKNSEGQCGRGIQVIESDKLSYQDLLAKAKASENDMVEEYVQQHDDLNKLSPSGLNTLRVITQLKQSGEVDILGVRLRISNNSFVDNLAAGNIAAPVDEKTGIVSGEGVFSDITKEDVEFHPVTKVRIVGFQVPKFEEAMQLARNAAMFDKSNTSIGWDIAITNNGVGLIEGNHDWCKLVWQLPVKKGLKSILESYV